MGSKSACRAAGSEKPALGIAERRRDESVVADKGSSLMRRAVQWRRAWGVMMTRKKRGEARRRFLLLAALLTTRPLARPVVTREGRARVRGSVVVGPKRAHSNAVPHVDDAMSLNFLCLLQPRCPRAGTLDLSIHQTRSEDRCFREFLVPFFPHRF